MSYGDSHIRKSGPKKIHGAKVQASVNLLTVWELLKRVFTKSKKD